MAEVKLKTNMIIEGTFLKFGSTIDESKVPLRFRKRKYILRPGEIDYDAINMEAQMRAAEEDNRVDEENDLVFEDDQPKVRVANKRLGRR
jgi:hypothetical protein